eukprot:gnl/TRDRNA2_/TRDRNA2_189792_c0_seq1.p2 gnl/TRDRNA2_/TRDRNA2_189792_c0~~gnl/TRDRNA2_/TRDRNA2_189792_c0_seq1.p2  ORF type:complete len:153 (+),score=11.92 gnl/TRDRNA2_/TRDRNA2_189792_c0_seq1:44-502(+)
MSSALYMRSHVCIAIPSAGTPNDSEGYTLPRSSQRSPLSALGVVRRSVTRTEGYDRILAKTYSASPLCILGKLLRTPATLRRTWLPQLPTLAVSASLYNSAVARRTPEDALDDGQKARMMIQRRGPPRTAVSADHVLPPSLELVRVGGRRPA